ncbi:AfsR family transcriptional regulator, partial [Streptomyces fuscigenes]|nr:AfsR family transcriptional regulator [Streptomyces fuscigenes]
TGPRAQAPEPAADGRPGDADTAAPASERATGPAPDDIASLLASLVDKSLVVAEPAAGTDGGMRYRLLETVAEYASERLDEADDRPATERRHLVHYRELARTTDPLLRGAGQGAALGTFRREYENLRTALRRAHAAGDEHEVLCLVLSLTWCWQMLDQRSEARHWTEAAGAMAPDPFAPPEEPAPPIPVRCTDSPPPMAEDVLQEARREVSLLKMFTADLTSGDWNDEREEWLRAVTRVYSAGLPQTCRFPGVGWLLALMFTGQADRLTAAMDETIRACEEFGYEWDLASVLQMRANLYANRGSTATAAARDAERALAIFERLGDAWGTAESLSARGEAHERVGRFADAAADYAAAVRHAEGLGARHHVALLRMRLAQNLLELDRGSEGEQILHEVLRAHEKDAGGGVHHELVPAARLFLALWLGRTARRAEAREQLRLAGEAFSEDAPGFFRGYIGATVSWLDVEDGLFEAARAGMREALPQALTPLSQLMAPEMVAVQLLTASRALAGLALGGGPAPARDAARLLGAYEAALPEGHIRSPFEQEQYEAAERDALAALSGDTAAREAARAEGAKLSLPEAAALI